jgi:ribosome biogenesis GTPase / thiamine phosphate phosphatase
MVGLQMETLSALGFDPYFQEQLSTSEAIPARVAAEHRGSYEVWWAGGRVSAQVAGRLSRGVDAETYPGVGDWVTLQSPPAEGEPAIINGVLDRRTLFTRGAAGKQSQGQVVAANVDLVFIVTGLDSDFSLRRIERYLARVWASGAQPIAVLNKTDLCENVDTRICEVEASCLGVPVLAISALDSTGSDPLRSHLKHGLTAAFVGSSGAGKSTLVNALLGEDLMPTQEVSSHDGRGRHTTTHRQLLLLPQGGILIDTPGMRELQLSDTDGLDAVFADIEELAENCRFRDCTHQSEPGCAVRDAITTADLAPDRLDHYLKLQSEAHSYQLRQDERLRREADRAFGKMVSRDGRFLRRSKEG